MQTKFGHILGSQTHFTIPDVYSLTTDWPSHIGNTERAKKVFFGKLQWPHACGLVAFGIGTLVNLLILLF
jgi:hypothetical protein